ncbi:hypothetical protein METBIDRAFT_47082, partial [Metschnikowia bicuspidata var. bicuspidata NRRL YB-4993]
MSISYANVAANPQQGTKNDSVEESLNVSASAPESPKLASSASQVAEPSSTPLNEDSPDTVSEEVPSETDSSVPAATPAPKAKKVLTPAPVPSKAVWGATGSVKVSHVDEHKWPTPDQVSVFEQSQQTSSKPAQPKDIKASKWVPINAKVVLPSPRSSQNSGAGNQQKNKRKNKNTRKNKSASAPGFDDS